MEMMLLQAAAPVLARAIGEALAAGDRAKADQLRQQALSQYKIALPDLPNLEAQLQGGTEFGKIQDDTKLTGFEDDALREMYQQGTSGALTPAEQQSQFEAESRAGEYARGTVGAGRRERDARGTAGGVGMDALDELVAQQGGIDRAHAGGMQAQALASSRRQNMIGAASNYARGLHGDRYGRAADRAGAQDDINARNTGALNEIHKFNVGTSLNVADRLYGATKDRAQDYEGYADNTVNTAVGVGDGVSKGAGGVGKYRGWK